MATLLVIVAIVAVVALAVWFAATRRHPERAAQHAVPDRHGSAQFHGDVHDRPAGPGAEADGVAGRGSPTPGPSAEALDVDERGAR